MKGRRKSIMGISFMSGVGRQDCGEEPKSLKMTVPAGLGIWTIGR